MPAGEGWYELVFMEPFKVLWEIISGPLFNNLVIEVTFFEISSLLSSRPQCVPIACSDLWWPWHYFSPHFLVAPH